MIRAVGLIPVWALLGGIPFSHPAAEVGLHFGFHASQEWSESLRKEFVPFLTEIETQMSETLGEPVTITMVIAGSPEEGIRNLVDGTVDFALVRRTSFNDAEAADGRIELLMEQTDKEGTGLNWLASSRMPDPTKAALKRSLLECRGMNCPLPVLK